MTKFTYSGNSYPDCELDPEGFTFNTNNDYGMTCGMLFPYSGIRLKSNISPVELFQMAPQEAFEKIKASGFILEYFKAFTEEKVLGSLSYQNEIDLEEIKFNILNCQNVKRLFFTIWQVKQLVIDYVSQIKQEAQEIASPEGLTYTLIDYYSNPDIRELVNRKFNLDPDSDKGFSKLLMNIKLKTENLSSLSLKDMESLVRKDFISLL